MFYVILFAFYFILFLFVVNQIAKRKIFQFNFWETSAIFSFKVALGCLYGYIFLKYYGGDDTWNFFNDSLPEYNKLIHQPVQFIKDFLPSTEVRQATGIVQGLGFYIRDLEYWLMVKLLAIFNLFSRGNYYIDVLFFNLFVCWGPFLLFKLLLSSFPSKKNVLFITIFFIPTITFWLSGIRGEGLLFVFIVLVLYYMTRWFERKRTRSLLWIIVGIAGFIILRLQFFVIFLPAFLSWAISKRGRKNPIFYFILIYTACICIFFGSMLIFPDDNFSTPLIKRQNEFFALHGNTRFNLDTLKPAATSFIRILPEAFVNTFARPFLWEAKGSLQWFAGIEIVMNWILLGFLLIYPERNLKRFFIDPLLLFFLFYGLSQILLIGYIVPFPGAIIRYKVIPEVFLIITMAIMIDWNKFFINYDKK